MKEKAEFPETLLEAIKYFANPDAALDFMVSMRWPDGVVKCPRCNSTHVSFASKRRMAAELAGAEGKPKFHKMRDRLPLNFAAHFLRKCRAIFAGEIGYVRPNRAQISRVLLMLI